MKEKKEELDEAIVRFSLEGIELAHRMQENKDIKQAIFSITLSNDKEHARIAPVVCGESTVMAQVLCQVALQDEWIKNLLIETQKLIEKGIKLPTIRHNIDNKD